MKSISFILFLCSALFSIAQDQPDYAVNQEDADTPLQQPIRNFAVSRDATRIVYITGNEAVFYDLEQHKTITRSRVPVDANDFEVDFDQLTIAAIDKEDVGIEYDGDGSNSYGLDFIKVRERDKYALMDRLMNKNPTLSLNKKYDLYAHQVKSMVDGWWEWNADLYFYKVPGDYDYDLQKFTTDPIYYEFDADFNLQSTKKTEVIKVLIQNIEDEVRSRSMNGGRFKPKLHSFKYRREHIFIYPVDTRWSDGDGNNGSHGNYAYVTYLPSEGIEELHYINLKTLEGFDIKNKPEAIETNGLVSSYGLKYEAKRKTYDLSKELNENYKTVVEVDEYDYEISEDVAQIELKKLKIKAVRTTYPEMVEMSFSKKEKGVFYMFPENLNYYVKKEEDFPEELIKIWKEGNGTFIPYNYELTVNPESEGSEALDEYYTIEPYRKTGMKNITNLNDLFKKTSKKTIGQVQYSYVNNYGESQELVKAQWNAYNLFVEFVKHEGNKSVLSIQHGKNIAFNVKVPKINLMQPDYKSVLEVFYGDSESNYFKNGIISAICPDTCYNDKTAPLAPALISGISSNGRFVFLESYRIETNSYYISIIDLKNEHSIYDYAISKKDYFYMPSFNQDFSKLTLPVSRTKSIVLDLEQVDEDGLAIELRAIYSNK